MNQQQRNTRTQIQGIVSVVFDLYEKFGGIIPQPEDFAYAIKVWMEEGRVITSFPGIDNKRLPVPEINYIIKKEPNHCVICDKYADGQTVLDNETVWMCFDCYTNTPEELEPYEEEIK